VTVTIVDTGPRKVSRSAEVQAPAAELFAMIADPRRHGELDGSGTVVETLSAPDQLTVGSTFSVRMKQYGVPYKITSRVTDLTDGLVVEWQHPLGHRWRWELRPLADDSTLVTETFDYSQISSAKAIGLELTRTPRKNAVGIEATLTGLQARYSSSSSSSSA
jgi:hypothetical protein